MDHLKLLRVANKMLFDLIAVLEKKETDFEIGCRCKDTTIAEALHKLLTNALQDCPVSVKVKEEIIVVVTPPSSDEVSSQQCLPVQTP